MNSSSQQHYNNVPLSPMPQQQQPQYNIHSPMTPSAMHQHQQYGNIQSPGGVNLQQQQNYQQQQQQTSLNSPMPPQQHLNSPAMPNSVSMIHSPVI